MSKGMNWRGTGLPRGSLQAEGIIPALRHVGRNPTRLPVFAEQLQLATALVIDESDRAGKETHEDWWKKASRPC